MTATLFRHGDGWALPLDPALVERMDLGANPDVVIVDQGKTFVVSPARSADPADIQYASPEEVAAARQEIHERYHEVFRKFAQ
jgi:hypothetical protein